jgi:phage terminase large subunit
MPVKAQRVINADKPLKVLWGGRRSAKTYSFVDALLIKAAFEPLLILCTRELQVTIEASIHEVLKVRIRALGLDDYFKIEKTHIYSKCGARIKFMGVRHNHTEIRGIEGVDICLVEEAEAMRQDSWDVLEATISKDGSEIWVNFNPEYENSPTYQKLIVNTPSYCAIEHMTFRDNKYFPKKSRALMEYERVNDPEKYEWKWEGKLKKYHDALIFTKVFKEEFEAPKAVNFYYGCDWGFSEDPLALTRMFIIGRVLYIDYEFYAVGVENTELHAAFETIPGIRQHVVKADCSRPETISYMNDYGGKRGDIEGFDVIGEGKLTIEEGIQFLRSFEKIVIHPRCPGALEDFGNYRWKQDAKTKEILTIPVDKSNHTPDNVRYALKHLIKVLREWGVG